MKKVCSVMLNSGHYAADFEESVRGWLEKNGFKRKEGEFAVKYCKSSDGFVITIQEIRENGSCRLESK